MIPGQRSRLVLLFFLFAGLSIRAGFCQQPAPVSQKMPFQLKIRNGAMTQGGEVPAFWDGKFGDAVLARDTGVYKIKPASFRVSISANKSGMGFQTITGGAGATFKLAGWIKSAGQVKAQVMVQAFAEGYRQNQFFQVRYQQGDSDWTAFEKEITLPSWTAFFNVGLLVEGDGKAWLDEVHEASQPVDSGNAEDVLTTGPPTRDKPSVAGWGFYPQFPQAWQAMHRSYLARTGQGAIPAVFLGDSITQGWGNAGKGIWEKFYAPLGAVNYGIGGDSTRQVLWRIDHGELDGIHPRLIVLMIGTNNLYGDFNAGTDEEITEGVSAIVHALRKKLPQTKILLVGLLPRQNDYFCGRIAEINRRIAPLDNGQSVRFLDIGSHFLNAPGKVKTELYVSDQLHLSPAGYQIWADAMQPLFTALLGKMPAPIGPGKTHRKVAEHWIAMPMTRPDTLAAGYTPGGEGCQYPQTICIDAQDGSFVLYGTDVGGIYRSINGGKTFQPCDAGYSAIGSCGFAIDPRNKSRCLSVGDNSGNEAYRYDGIYLSTDQGATWKQTLPKLNRGNEKAREQIAYDPGSYDIKKGYCTVAYWAEEGNAEEADGRLYKTTDGGETWAQVAAGAAYSGGTRTTLLKIHPKTGVVYLANESGFFKSKDGGVTFARKQSGNFTGMDVVPKLPNTVYLSTEQHLFRSDNSGETFAPIHGEGKDAFYRVRVSPADPRRMITQNPKNGERYFSTDGGLTWTRSRKNMAASWIAPEILYNDRARLVVWHPTNPEIAWGIGPGDIITKTEDHGKTFQWANNGNNGIMIGGLFNFNAQNPDVLYFGSQDYNGALTADGGKTWKFINLSRDNILKSGRDDGDPWGWVYGGYAASDKIMFGGNRAYTEKNYNLWITFDGGKKTQQKVTDLTGAQVSNGDPTDPNVLFCWAYRSTDRGQNWTKMENCEGVFTTAVKSGHSELFGSNGQGVVHSSDKGAAWQLLVTLPARVRDIAYDMRHDRLYIAAEDNHLYRCEGPGYSVTDLSERLPRDQHGDGFMTSTVAVDPIDPRILYAGANGTGLFFQRNNGVARSLDGGETWERLTCNPDYSLNAITGAQMASAIRVHPVTRYLYVGTDCYGMWKIAPPTPNKGRAGTVRAALP